MRVRCYDHVVRTFEHSGYFWDTKVLRALLRRWDGCQGPDGSPYEYFETPEQALANDAARRLNENEIRRWAGLFYSETRFCLNEGKALCA